jgi:hypothetical protein
MKNRKARRKGAEKKYTGILEYWNNGKRGQATFSPGSLNI